MTQIDGASRLAALIRTQVATLGKTAGRAEAGGAKNEAVSGGARKRTANDGDLASVIARRVSAIDPNDPDRPRKAFRVFLESVLLAEFGEALMNDARFFQLVDDVQKQMESEPEIAEAIKEASRLLT